MEQRVRANHRAADGQAHLYTYGAVGSILPNCSYAFMWSTGEIQNILYIASNFLHICWMAELQGRRSPQDAGKEPDTGYCVHHLPMHIQCVTVCSLMFVSVVPALLCHIKHLVQHCPHL